MSDDRDAPTVTARVEPTWATIEVAGEQRNITARNEEEVRQEVIRQTIKVASDANSDVNLVATDHDGSWHLTVSPEGDIFETPPGTSPVRQQHRNGDLDGDDDARSAPRSAAHSSGPVTIVPAEQRQFIGATTSGTPAAAVTPPPVPPHSTNFIEPPAADPGEHVEPTPPQEAPLPTLADFHATQPPPAVGPAQHGFRGLITRSTGGVITMQPGKPELRHREAVASVTRSLSGPRTICIINPKGGAHKTTAAMLIAATFGMHRGGYTLAWDNNETRGTLGWRAHKSRHTNTAVDLLNDLDRFTDLRGARVGDLDNYVRSQADARFDVLASDEDAAASSMIDGEGFSRLHETLQRFYRIIVVDTGNNMRASNWEAAVAAADQLVIVMAIREDTAGGAAWMVEGLAGKGHQEKLRNAVTVLSAPERTPDPQLRERLRSHFGSLTREVVEVPHDPALVSGGAIVIDDLSHATREAWLDVSAKIADGL